VTGGPLKHRPGPLAARWSRARPGEQGRSAVGPMGGRAAGARPARLLPQWGGAHLEPAGPKERPARTQSGQCAAAEREPAAQRAGRDQASACCGAASARSSRPVRGRAPPLARTAAPARSSRDRGTPSEPRPAAHSLRPGSPRMLFVRARSPVQPALFVGQSD